MCFKDRIFSNLLEIYDNVYEVSWLITKRCLNVLLFKVIVALSESPEDPKIHNFKRLGHNLIPVKFYCNRFTGSGKEVPGNLNDKFTDDG